MKVYGQENRVLFGSGGAGTSLYIVQKSLLDALDISSDTITQNGTAEGLANLMAGTVDVAMSSFKDAADYVKSGEIVPILWFGDGTYSDGDTYQDVPSAQDNGIEINYSGFYYYSIRSGSDQAFVDELYYEHLKSRGLLRCYEEDMKRRYEEGPVYDSRPTPLPTKDYADVYIADRALDYLGQVPMTKPRD